VVFRSRLNDVLTSGKLHFITTFQFHYRFYRTFGSISARSLTDLLFPPDRPIVQLPSLLSLAFNSSSTSCNAGFRGTEEEAIGSQWRVAPVTAGPTTIGSHSRVKSTVTRGPQTTHSTLVMCALSADRPTDPTRPTDRSHASLPREEDVVLSVRSVPMTDSVDKIRLACMHFEWHGSSVLADWSAGQVKVP
jgi:hypothetical protein